MKEFYKNLSVKEKAWLLWFGSLLSLVTLGAVPTILGWATYFFRKQIAAYAVTSFVEMKAKNYVKSVKNRFNFKK